MDEIIKFVSRHFFEIFVFALLCNIAVFGLRIWKRRETGIVFPNVNDADVAFAERFASGSSHKSFITRLGGASNCLTVIVTKSHLAITTFFPFSIFAGTYDLEHVIPRANITRVENRGRVTEVEFLLRDGSHRKLSLRLGRTTDFLLALKEQKDSEQGEAGQPPLAALSATSPAS